MELIDNHHNVPNRLRGAVVALGNFDGVHRGHQVVLLAAKTIAHKTQKPFGVITFEPHPRAVLFPTDVPYRLTPAPAKRHLLKELGVEVLFEIPFTKELSKQTAKEFMDDVLCASLGITHAVAGHDFVFGHKRSGDMQVLRTHLATKNIAVTEIAPQNDGGGILWSSTRIRACIAEGDMPCVASMLGRNWEIEGKVVEGDRRGGTIGFPTANIALHETLRPKYGVYAVRFHVNGQSYGGVANIGLRPTVDGQKDGLEAHLFGFLGNLYGADARVEMLQFIRPEQRFDGLEALKAQIAFDCRAAEDILARHS